jgi:hypothetical protein
VRTGPTLRLPGIPRFQVDPNAPAGGGGPGRFRVAKRPGPVGSRITGPASFQLPKSVGQSRRFADPRYFEEVKPGTREEVTDRNAHVRILVERQRDGLYHWLIETLDGNQMCEGVYNPTTKFTAEVCEDRTSKQAIKALEEEVEAAKKQAVGRPTVAPAPSPREIIVIVHDDWLTKISQRRWGTFEWHRYLRPTPATLDARRQRGEAFNPDLIYPGDTFEVLRP